ncbi:hypothetical protein ABK040_000376 [Willaertia magna]
MTSIDFMAMLREERKKALKGCSTTSNNTNKASNGNNKKNVNKKNVQLENIFQTSLNKLIMENTSSSILSDFVNDQFLLKNQFLGDIYYFPNYITEEEEKLLVEAIYEKQEDNNNNGFYKTNKDWISLSKRRLKNIGGVPHPSGMFLEELPAYVNQLKQLLQKRGQLIENFLTKEEILNDLKNNNLSKTTSNNFNEEGNKEIIYSEYNQVLLNEYHQGKGISPHKDGPLYLPCALVLSLKTSARIDFYGPNRPLNKDQLDNDIVASVFLEPRSLLVFCKDSYVNYYHAIRDLEFDNILDDKVLNRDSIVIENKENIPRGDIRLSLTIRCVKNINENRSYTENEKEEIERRKKWWENAIDN